MGRSDSVPRIEFRVLAAATAQRVQWDYRNADAGNEAERELLLDMVRRHAQQRRAMH
jgi:hypothetical protein